MAKITPQLLIKKLKDVPIKFVEKPFIMKGGKKREVSGLWKDDEITVSLQSCRQWHNADTAIQIIVHELIHAIDESLNEKEVLALEMDLFKKSALLREVIARKIINLILFDKPRD